jgi:hypothetical protein
MRLLRQFTVSLTPTEAVTIAFPAMLHTVSCITWEMCTEAAVSGLFNLGGGGNCFRSCDARHNHDIKTNNRCFTNVTKLRYLGTTVRNKKLIHKEIKRRLNSCNACFHSVQNILSSRLLSKNVKIRIYKTTICL